uniref:Uncharacterized protein n=1 Tax=Phytophthora ramorum TaxID=164328 RepID=H3H9M2_PHYRM
IESIKVTLKKKFSIKELGELKYCLGIEIDRNREDKTILMNQRAYIKRLAEKFGVDKCKAVHTPADCNSKLVKMTEEEAFVAKYPYRELVGALMYLATCTRPDIAQAVGEVAKFCKRYNKSHWVAAKRILKYLKTTQDMGTVFNGAIKGEPIGYADANWAGDLDTRRSTTGYVFFLDGSAISWKSKRQPTVATSSTEAEYMSLYTPKFKTEPFDGSNYTLWSYKMKMYLMSKGLWEAVEGKAEASSSKEQQAHAAIVLNLNDSQLMHVVTAKSAKEAWEKLEKFHRAQDVANRLWLKEKFSSFKYTTSSVSKHVTELEQLVLEMKSAGCEPSDEDVCATLLRSLPASYESLVQAFRMSMTELKLTDLVGKLIAEEVRQKDSTRIEEATALLANKGYTKDTKKKQ